VFILELILFPITIVWLVPATVMPESPRVRVTVLGLHVLLTISIVTWLILAWGQPIMWLEIFLPGGILSGIRLAAGIGRALIRRTP
jgi:hypothetical protein